MSMLIHRISGRTTTCGKCSSLGQRRNLQWHLHATGNGARREDDLIGPGPDENFVSVERVLSEAAGLGDNFVFEDTDDDEPVWEQEARIAAQPLENVADLPEPKGVLNAEQADILTAYSSEQGFQEVPVQFLKARLDGGEALLLLDVRTAEEYATGCIPGARNMSMDSLSTSVKAGALDDFKEAPVAVVCQSGRQSAQAVVRLQKVFGFTGAVNVQGGTSAWAAAGYPLQK